MQSRCHLGVQFSEDFTVMDLEGSTSKMNGSCLSRRLSSLWAAGRPASLTVGDSVVPHHLDLSTGCLSVLTIWQLAFPGQSEWRENRGGSCSASYSLVSDLHTPSLPLDFVRSKSLSPADTQGEKNYAPPLEGKSVKEFVDIFLKPPWYLFSPLYR